MRPHNKIRMVPTAFFGRRQENGYSVTAPFARNEIVSRDNTLESIAYSYDALGRPTSRNNDAFGYNERGEVTSASIMGWSPSPSTASYGYDGIGNLQQSTFNAATNAYTANSLNQYTSIQEISAPSAPPREPTYDLDGNMLSDGILSFTYDAASRLKTVSSNGVTLVTNFYDAKSRRVKKVTPNATTTFFYDGWNLVEERIAYADNTTSTIRYFWGKDLSGSFQGAGGVGGLLWLTIDGVVYIPCYDNNGNVTRYLNANGGTFARYSYDAFGRLIARAGRRASFFRHRFSTKYYDSETGLYYYGYRFYHPVLMRWLNRDPIEEEGGMSLYGFVVNNPVSHIDFLGEEVRTVSGITYEVPSFFSNPQNRAEENISRFVQVTYQFNEVPKHRNFVAIGDYYCVVRFTPRFTPPKTIWERLSSHFTGSFWGHGGLGVNKNRFMPSKTEGNMPESFWGNPEVVSTTVKNGFGNFTETTYVYHNKKFKYGYYLLHYDLIRKRLISEKHNGNMYATWHHKLQVLPQDDEAVAYHFDRCEAVIVLYGDAGCEPSVKVFKGK